MKKVFYWMLVIVLICGGVAPSILHIMGLSQPGEMTGKCLISDN